jgi:DnaJ family protein C protein 17
MAARRAEMDAKRKAGVDELVAREEAAKRRREEVTERKRAAAREEEVRDAGRRMVEEARARAAAVAKPPPPPPTQAQEKPAPPPIGPTDLTLMLQLFPESALASEAALRPALAKYGAISDIVIMPGKAAKAGKKARGARAAVEFAPGNWGGCWACLRDNSGSGSPVEKGAKAKWAGQEPAWVAWAEKYASPAERGTSSSTSTNDKPTSARSFGSAPAFSSAPDFSDLGASLSAHDRKKQDLAEEEALKSAYESATLLRMRQKERERLEQQIREQEEAEEA